MALIFVRLWGFISSAKTLKFLSIPGVVSMFAKWLKPKPHPETGDMLTPSERFSWFVQKIIRRWEFVGAYTAISWYWWYRNGAFRPHFWSDPTLSHWNVVASLGALQIESAVGIVVIRQMVRDRKTIKQELDTLKVMNEIQIAELCEMKEMHAEMREHFGIGR